MITIKRNLNTIVTEVNPLTSSTLVKAVMGDEQITLAWEQAQYTELHIGDYIEYEGAQWTLNSLPTVKKNSSRSFRYDAIFQSTKYDLAKAMFLLFDNTSTPPPPGEVGQNRVIPPKGEFSMTGNAQMFMELLVANLNRVAGSSLWSLGQVIEDTDYITLTFSNEDCLSVLSRLADEFDTEYHISNRIIHLKRISTNRELTLEYRSTLYDVERLSTDDSGLVTRLYPYGSTRNLPGNYRGGNMPLCIPEDMGQYIESENALLYGIAERSMTFGEVYPRLSSGDAGVVTSMGVIVESETFIFTDAALDFDVNDHLLDGTKAKVHFNTGQCAGYEFEIHRYSHSTKTFTLIPNNQENDFVLPTEHIRPQVGDKYVLLDIAMPESYRVNAEQELAGKAAEWLEQNDTPKVTYKATFSAIYARQNLQNVECGDTVQIVDSDLGIDEEIRIVKLTKGIADYWTVQFDLSDTVTKTTLQHITDGIATVQNDIVTSNVRINENTRRSYLNTKELRDMVFDGEGYFDPENIKPLSIETSMLTVGARPQSFQLSMLLQPNYAGNAQVLQWGAGVLAHFTIDDDEVVEWVIPQGSITISGSNQTKGLYIYARCSRTTSSGTLYLDSAQYAFDHDPNYWYFLVGVLHSPVDGVRGISLTYGQTTINGRFLNTGRVQSANGETFFDLDTGVIQGNIRFKSGQSAEDYIDGEIGNIDVGGENLLTHNPDNWELGTFNSTTGNPTNSSVNIRTKNMVTFSANKDHIINRFGSGTLYAYEYTGSGGTGFVKMTTITSFPHLIPKLTSARYYKFRITTSNLNLLGSTYRFKVEQGNIPTDWSLPQSDLEDGIDGAMGVAADAKGIAQDAQDAADGATGIAEDAMEAVEGIDVGGVNLLTHNPENWELGTFNSTTGNPTNSSANIRTKNMVTFAANKDHIINRFGSGTLYAYEYTGSGGTGFVKMTTITTFPYRVPKLTATRYYKFRIATSNLNLLGSTYRFKVEKGNIPTDWSLSPDDLEEMSNEALIQAQLLAYLQEAFNNDTTIQGGLIATSLIRLGAEMVGAGWVESAGLYGGESIQGDGTPRVWSGGSHEKAIERVTNPDSEDGAKFVVTHGGKLYAMDVQLMGSLSTAPSGERILLDPASNSVLLIDNENEVRAVISSSALPSLNSILLNTQRAFAFDVNGNIAVRDGRSDSYSRDFPFTLIGDKLFRIIIPSLVVDMNTSILAYPITTERANAEVSVVLVTPSGNNIILYNKVVSGGDSEYATIPEKRYDGMPPGQYRVEVRAFVRTTGMSTFASASIERQNSSQLISTSSPSHITSIHRNGMFIWEDANNYIYHSPNEIVEKVKEAPDRSGVLLGASVNSVGGFANVWGPKQHGSSQAVKNSTGRYTVYHSVGHEDYVVTASPRLNNSRSHHIVSKYATYFVIEWRTIGNLVSLVDTAFDFIAVGSN